MRSQNCCLIGNTSLIIQCIEALISNNFNIICVVSPENVIKQWLSYQNITHFPTLTAATDFLLQNDLDFLFSIVNMDIIPTNLLVHVKSLAINFHDSYLPKYAGRHATSWAILNNEAQHGVSWHVISKIIDGGDILKHAVINITPNDTAFTLNLKCYREALKLFAELVLELKTNSYQLIKQDLSIRFYHSSYNKPFGNAWINWKDSAHNLDLLVRALSFDNYINEFSVPKFTIYNHVFVVKQLIVTNDTSDTTPGTINKISYNSWQISTATNNVELLIADTNGATLDVEEISAKFGITNGTILALPHPDSYNKLQQLCEILAKHEKFWVQQLLMYNQNELNCIDGFSSLASIDNFIELGSINLPERLYLKFKSITTIDIELPFLMLTFWVIHIFNTTGTASTTLICDLHLDTLSPFFSHELPFTVLLTGQENYFSTYQLIKNQYNFLQQHGTFLHDVLVRYPELYEINHAKISFSMCDMATMMVNTKVSPCVQSSIIFSMNDNGEKITSYINAGFLKQESIRKKTEKISQDLLKILEFFVGNNSEINTTPISKFVEIL